MQLDLDLASITSLINVLLPICYSVLEVKRIFCGSQSGSKIFNSPLLINEFNINELAFKYKANLLYYI
jgi:hypothetical protein